MFHLFILVLFIITPLIMLLSAGNDSRALWGMIMLCSQAPFYFLNVKYYIPSFLNKGKYLKYIFSLVISFVVSYSIIALHYSLFGNEFIKEIMPVDRTLPPPLFMAPLLIFFSIGISFESIVESLRQKKSREEALKEKLNAELSFLKSQINPHFLFNSLNSIYALSNSKSELTNEAIILLSDMMRYMLFDSNSEKVSLSKEIQYIKNYIALQKFRISQKKNIYIRFNYDGEPNGFHVEPLLFIPFVENAFKHGISYNETSIIDITLRISENKLTFEALNSCPKYQQKSLLEDKKESSGIGCTNVARRLKLLYPEKHSLTLNNGDDSFSAKLELKLN